MLQIISCSLWREGSTRVWKICGLVSLLLHGLALGVAGFVIPVNLASHQDNDMSVSIDLEMLATGAPQPQALPAEPAASPEPTKQVEPEKVPDLKPTPQKAEAPKPKKAEARKQEQPKKNTAAKGRSDDQPQESESTVAKTSGKSAGEAATVPALIGGASSPRPVYPELARKRGQEGTVSIHCQVDAQGSVTAVSIAKSSGFKLLDEAALKAVRKWKFRPASKAGASVAGTAIVPVQFKLE